MPTDLGLASSPSTATYVLDKDKFSRLNSLNNNSLSYIQMGNAAELTNIAFGVSVSQVMTVTMRQSSNSTVGATTYFHFIVSTSIDSKPANTNLHGYIVSHDYLGSFNETSEAGTGDLHFHLPSASTSDALLILFARASFDDRITSYAVYNFADSTQESTPSNTKLSLSPLNYTLHFNDSSSVTVQDVYALSYSYQQSIASIENSQCFIPNLLDRSPIILVAGGVDGGVQVQEWTAYPQIPLTCGSDFKGTEKNVFSYMVTVDGVLYKLELSLGGLPP